MGAAVQDGASLSFKNGIVADNRESGILAIGADISLENVAVKNTLPRSCTENGNCIFAPSTDFGHGISLYASSLLRFGSIILFNKSQRAFLFFFISKFKINMSFFIFVNKFINFLGPRTLFTNSQSFSHCWYFYSIKKFFCYCFCFLLRTFSTNFGFFFK